MNESIDAWSGGIGGWWLKLEYRKSGILEGWKRREKNTQLAPLFIFVFATELNGSPNKGRQRTIWSGE